MLLLHLLAHFFGLLLHLFFQLFLLGFQNGRINGGTVKGLAETEYVAYVSEQNLLPDTSNEPVRHPQIAEVFDIDEKGRYKARTLYMN